MPIFEYKCSKCGQLEELLVKQGAKKAPKCPKCGAAMDKMFSTFAPRMAAEKSASCAKNPSCPNAGSCPGAM